jgi:PDZ domain-containing protein
MFNNFYDRFKNFMKENFLFLLFLILFVVVTFVRVPYEVNMPGGVINLGNRVTVDGESVAIDGSFNMAYVSVVQGSIPYILLSYIIPDWDVVPESETMYENETIEDANKRSKLYLEQSIDYATVVAMDQAGVAYQISNRVNYVAFIGEEAKTTLKVGDNILSINGEEIEDINVMSDRIQDIKPGEEVSFIVLRNNKEVEASAVIYEEDGKNYVGISAITTFDLDTDVDIKISTKASESGPSGGMMMTLMVYNALTKQDLTHGMNIVGTGTINLDGSVGDIGGVKYKLMGAVKNDADVFLVPSGDYEEGMEDKKEKGYKVGIVLVETF